MYSVFVEFYDKNREVVDGYNAGTAYTLADARELAVKAIEEEIEIAEDNGMKWKDTISSGRNQHVIVLFECGNYIEITIQKD